MQIFLGVDPADIPSAQQKKMCVRYGRPVVFTDERVRKAKQHLVECLKLAMFGKPCIVCEAYKVNIVFVFKPKTLRKSEQGKPKTTRPDLDNMGKLVLDAIQEAQIAFEDDGEVSTLTLRKRNADEDEEAHTFISIREDSME